MRLTGFLLLLVLLAPAFGQSTKPATQPAFADQLKLAEASAISKWHASDGYKAIKKTADDRELILIEARKTGTAQQRLDASRNFVAANEAVKAADKKAIDGDSEVRRVRDLLAEDDRQKEIRKAEEAARVFEAKRKAEADPANVAMRSGKLVIGMTPEQVKTSVQNRFGKGYRVDQRSSTQTADGYQFVIYDVRVVLGNDLWRTISVGYQDGKSVVINQPN